MSDDNRYMRAKAKRRRVSEFPHIDDYRPMTGVTEENMYDKLQEQMEGMNVLGALIENNQNVCLPIEKLRGHTAFREWQLRQRELTGEDVTYQDWLDYLREPATEAAEESRALNEEIRKEEQQRQQDESLRKAAEQEREKAESVREDNERQRIGNENARIKAENERADAEAAREEREKYRCEAESSRNEAEQERNNSEEQRRACEREREDAETLRQKAEELRNIAEKAREAAEQSREENELQRGENERIRSLNEEDRIEKMDEIVETFEKLLEELRVTVTDAPTDMELDYPEYVLLAGAHGKIVPALTPTYLLPNVIYQICEGSSLKVEPDGTIVPLETGITKVHIIPTGNTGLYMTVEIEVKDYVKGMAFSSGFGRGFNKDAKYAVFSTKRISFTKQGGSQAVKVESNEDWKININENQ